MSGGRMGDWLLWTSGKGKLIAGPRGSRPSCTLPSPSFSSFLRCISPRSLWSKSCWGRERMIMLVVERIATERSCLTGRSCELRDLRALISADGPGHSRVSCFWAL